MTQSIKTITGVGSIAFAAFMLLALPLSFAQASDLFDGSYDFYPDTQSYDFYQDTSSYDFYPDTQSYDFYPDTQSYDFYPNSSGYSTGGYSSGGYSTGGYSTGGYNYSTPVYRAPTNVYTTPNSNVYAPTTVTTNNNSCTNNSCNNDDHSVVNIQNPAPVINNVVANYGGSNGYVAPQQYCAQGYYGTYPNCYRSQPVVAYAATPYVSLSQVPYTGLELGFWGTIAYWGAFVLFALVVAYLIAIKRVQNTIARKMKNFLFGTTEVEYVEHSAVAVATTPAQARSIEFVAPAAAQSSEDVIDSFILSQVNRPRRA